jgi:hypothetical protein
MVIVIAALATILSHPRTSAAPIQDGKVHEPEVLSHVHHLDSVTGVLTPLERVRLTTRQRLSNNPFSTGGARITVFIDGPPKSPIRLKPGTSHEFVVRDLNPSSFKAGFLTTENKRRWATTYILSVEVRKYGESSYRFKVTSAANPHVPPFADGMFYPGEWIIRGTTNGIFGDVEGFAFGIEPK